MLTGEPAPPETVEKGVVEDVADAPAEEQEPTDTAPETPVIINVLTGQPESRIEEFDDFVNSAAKTLDPLLRAEHMHEAEMRVLDGYPIIPLYFFVSKHLVGVNIENFKPNILDVHGSQYIKFSDVEP